MGFLESVQYEDEREDSPKDMYEILERETIASEVLASVQKYAEENGLECSAEGFKHGVHLFIVGDATVYFRMGIAHGGMGYCSVKASDLDKYPWWSDVVKAIVPAKGLEITTD